MIIKAYLEITMKIKEANRGVAAKVYTDYGFDSIEHANAYLNSDLFKNDVFTGLKPLWDAEPCVKIYTVA